MKPYLVQRCNFRTEFDKLGAFDANVRCDYMGSAEFEFGSLPKSLRAICASVAEYKWFTLPSNDNVHYFAKHQDDELERFINAHCKKPYPSLEFDTKEHTAIYGAVNHHNDSKIKSRNLSYPDLWWDIENHVFIVYDKQIKDAKYRIDTIIKNYNKKHNIG